MEIIRVIITSLVSLVVLFILTKLMGNRQVSELTMFDYVIGISIGSIAAEMATELDKPVNSLVAMVVYAGVAILISFITSKFIKTRRILFGKSVELMKNGEILRKGLKKAHLDLSEFLMQARTAGYFDITDINAAFMEPNGKISFLPFSNARPVNAKDLLLPTKEDEVMVNVIADGVILEKNLKTLGFNKQWLMDNMKKQAVKNEKSVLLATADKNGTLNLFLNK